MNNKLGLLFLSAVLMAAPAIASAAVLTRSLDLGVSGADVSSLQTYLASDASLYPSGLVTGYYGQLTKAAIERFQTRNGIVSSGTPATTGYGRVGPTTLAALNLAMNGSTGTPVSGVSAPSISNLGLNVTSSSATISFNTPLSARGKVHYSTTYPVLTEGSATAPAQIGGSVVTESTYGSSHSLMLTGLSSNTTYYYVVEAEDANGRQTIMLPATFRTQ